MKKVYHVTTSGSGGLHYWTFLAPATGALSKKGEPLLCEEEEVADRDTRVWCAQEHDRREATARYWARPRRT